MKVRASMSIGVPLILALTLLASSAYAEFYSALHLFANSPDGSQPLAGLVPDGNTLYGTTRYGGSAGNGTIFKINVDGTGYSIIRSFSGGNWTDGGYTNADGRFPQSEMLFSGGLLYGTASEGGSNCYGTVFRLGTNGNDFTVIKHCAWGVESYPNGLALAGPMLYGTSCGQIATNGGYGGGTIFRIQTNGSDYSVLKQFSGAYFMAGGYIRGESAHPFAGVTVDGEAL